MEHTTCNGCQFNEGGHCSNWMVRGPEGGNLITDSEPRGCHEPEQSLSQGGAEKALGGGPSVIEPLDRQGEALLSTNVVDTETILVKLKGNFGEAFVVTDRGIYVLKWGWMTGHTFGGQCGAYGFDQVVGLEIRKELRTGALVVLTAADRNTKANGTLDRLQEAIRAGNSVTFTWDTQAKAYQRGVSIAREMMQKALNASTTSGMGQQSAADEIGKLALLRDKGILTEEEFKAKKRQLLGL